jgi:hypothetical protein
MTNKRVMQNVQNLPLLLNKIYFFGYISSFFSFLFCGWSIFIVMFERASDPEIFELSF